MANKRSHPDPTQSQAIGNIVQEAFRAGISEQELICKKKELEELEQKPNSYIESIMHKVNHVREQKEKDKKRNVRTTKH
jgi:hypothetical protein